VWERSLIKKAVMTIPYNVTPRSMVDYVKNMLIQVDCTKDGCTWYSTSAKNNKIMINHKDINLLIGTLKYVIDNYFQKIRKLTRYLKNISILFNTLNLPIVWSLPTGLTIKQSYLEVKSTTITPFMHRKVKINLQTTIKDRFDKEKQKRALMPNLIHSLDASSMSLFCYIKNYFLFIAVQFNYTLYTIVLELHAIKSLHLKLC
jgi:DNA-directed RNA polymerase